MGIRVFILLFSLSMVYSCNTTKETTLNQEPVIFAGTFLIDTVYGKSVETGEPNLKINDRTSEISGFAGCNSYSTTFTKNNTTITFSVITATERYCDESVMKKERQFLNIFGSPKEFTIKDDTLFLYEDGKEVLKATRFIF